MDHVWYAFAPDRTDRKIDVLQSEAMGRDLLQRESLGGKSVPAPVRKLCKLCPRALFMVMNFTVNLSMGKFGNSFISPCATITPPLRFRASIPSNIGMRACACRAVERDVDAFAGGDLHDARKRVLLLNVDHMIGAENFGDVQARPVF